MSRRTPHAAKLAMLATVLIAAAAPPNVATANEPSVAAPAGEQLSGSVRTASGDVAGATVRLYAAGARGARRLAAATTAADGSWSLSYARPKRGTVLYATAAGGAVGGDALDRRVRLLAVAGSSGSLPGATLTLEERSTVAGAYALARFIRGATVSGPAPGLPNAAALAANLYEARAGKVGFVLSTSPNGNATEALATFNTLANALAACTSGGAGDCDRLLSAARPAGGRRPADTLAAAIAIARNPSQSTGSIFRVAKRVSGRAAYGPALKVAPSTWTLALVFTGSGMNAPGRAAFDAQGRQWIVNNFQTPGTTPGLYLTVLDGAGLPALGQLGALSGGGVYGSGWGVAIDRRGRAWVANFAGDSISVFDARGRALSPRGGWTKGGFSRPQGVAVDRSGNVWVANFGNDSVTLIPRATRTAPATSEAAESSNRSRSRSTTAATHGSPTAPSRADRARSPSCCRTARPAVARRSPAAVCAHRRAWRSTAAATSGSPTSTIAPSRDSSPTAGSRPTLRCGWPASEAAGGSPSTAPTTSGSPTSSAAP